MFFNGPLSVIRRAPSTYDLATGLWTEGNSTPVTVQATVQPVKAMEVDKPEGSRIDDTIKIYSDMKLFAADPSTGMPGDLVNWQGRTYEVQDIWDYSTQPFLSHFKSMAVILQTSEET